MLTYDLKKSPGVPLYEALYRCIRSDILSGKLSAGTKLPSKRALSAQLEISKITVEAAYDQLCAEGYFEKHINRMRKFYRLHRNQLLQIIANCPKKYLLTIEEADAGLHFLLKVNTSLSDEALERCCAQKGLAVHSLSHYYQGAVPQDRRSRLVINYSGLREEDITVFEKILGNF